MILNRRHGWIGVDIGTHAVKLVQVARHGAQLRLRAAAMLQRRDPWNAEDLMQSPPRSSVEEIRGSRLLENAFVGRDAASVFPMSLCEMRNLNVASGAETERRGLIARELDTIYGRGAAEYEFDFWDSPRDEADGTAARPQANVLCIPGRWASQIAKDHAQAKLSCRVLDGLPFALARAVRLAGISQTGAPVGVIDLGGSTTTLCVVISGYPAFVRCLPVPGYGDAVGKVGQALTLSNGEAIGILAETGLPNPSDTRPSDVQSAIFEIVTGHLESIVDELERTLIYAGSQDSSLVPEQFCLFGGGATLKNMDSWLSRKLDMPVKTWDLSDGQVAATETATACPLVLLGPAIASSTLCWKQ